MSFDTLVRAALRDIADEGAVTKDFSDTAWRRGRRQRARRHTYISVAAACAVAATVGGSTLLAETVHAPRADPSVASTAPIQTSASHPSPARVGSVHAPGAIAVGGGWIIGSGPSSDGTWVYNRFAGRYVDLHHSYAVPAPTGPYVAIQDNGASPSDQRVGVLDLANGHTRWIATGQTFLGLDWNADGSQLVYRSTTNSGVTSIHVIDAATGDDRTLTAIPDNGDTGPAWLPGGTRFAIGVDNQGPGNLAQTYNATTGQPDGQVVVFDSLTDWSPDGRHVIRASDCSIVDAAQQTVVTTLNPDCDASRIYWAGDNHVIMLRYGSTSDNGWVTYDLNGTETSLVPMPREFVIDEPDHYTLTRR